MASLGAWPASIRVRTCSFVPQTNQRANASPGGGSEQVVDILNDRWIVMVSIPMRRHTNAAAVEAFLASFRGMVNTVNLWHFVRPQPRGTMRGTPTLSAAASQGAASLSITTTAGATLLAGDMIGVGGLLLQVQSDAAADGAGAMTVTLVNRIRTALASGAGVTWDKPTAPFRKLSDSGVMYVPGGTEEISVTLGEAIS